MRVRSASLLSLFLVVVLQASENWPQFRGPTGDGHSDATTLPVTWSEQEHVKWKTAIPGEGWSSPVIEGSQIWMQTALDDGKSLRAVCVHRDSGKILHDVEVFHVPSPAPKHAFNSHASPTPVIENGRVYISYGMYGMACLRAATGKVIWTNRELKHDHDKNGPGSSPIIYRDLFILNCDGTEERFVAALDRFSGKLVWRTNRSNEINKAGEFKKAYHTPLIINVNSRDQLVSLGAFRVSAYEPLTGKEIWWVDIPGFSNVPRPVFGSELVYISTGFGKPELWAIRPDGYGNVTKTHVAWKVTRHAPAKPSPLMVGDQFFMVSDGGIATFLDGKTGRELWSGRVPGEYSASSVYAAGRLYLFNQQGQTIVMQANNHSASEETRPTILATNSLENGFMSSPAIAGKAFFLRTKKHLYRIEE
jgi:outer membrane protein assembly factor BamB